jgi:hypothetical protein
MAGKIIADTLETGAGADISTSYVVNGSAKVWSNLNGTGTIAARDSFSITSYTDNGTGDYTHTFTNAMGNVNYCWQLTVDYEAGTAKNGNIGGDSSSQTTAAIRLHSYGLSNSVENDFDTINVSLLGDLA